MATTIDDFASLYFLFSEPDSRSIVVIAQSFFSIPLLLGAGIVEFMGVGQWIAYAQFYTVLPCRPG